MSTRSKSPGEASLFGRTRSSLLALLYGHADESFHLRQLVRTVGGGHGAVQRELSQLTNLGLIAILQIKKAQSIQKPRMIITNAQRVAVSIAVSWYTLPTPLRFPM